MKYAQLVMGSAGTGKVGITARFARYSPLQSIHWFAVDLLLCATRALCDSGKIHAGGQLGSCCGTVQILGSFRWVCYLLEVQKQCTHTHVQPPADIRDLISVEDVMSELQLGPNGGLMYCME
jgi:hypothetical protein